MNKFVRAIALAVSVFTLSGSLVACGSKSSSKGGDEIVVWSKINTDKEVELVNKAAQDWASKNGKKVKVVGDKSEYQAFLQAANSSSGPDVVFGVAHDNLDNFRKAGLLAEIPSYLFDKSQFNPKGVEAVSYDGKMYAAPIAVETALLFYNTDKVKEDPKTFESVIDQGKTLGFKYDINNIYFSFPFVAANGGYVFKNNNGKLDPTDIGMGNDGAVKGYQLLQDMVQKDKLMTPDIKGDMAKGEFQNGNTAFYIGGPWDVNGFKEAGVHFKAMAYPTLAGNPASAFIGIQTAFVNAKKQNQKDSLDLMKYLVENTGEALFDTTSRIPALNKDAELSKIKEDPTVQAVLQQAKTSIPMPNIAEVQAMWKMNDSMSLLTGGQMTAKDYAAKVLSDMKQGIDQMK